MGNNCCSKEEMTTPDADNVTAISMRDAPVQPQPEAPEVVPEKCECESPKNAKPPSPVPAKNDDKKLAFVFRDTDSNNVDITFETRPIGIDFFRTTPLKVKATQEGSAAEAKGVKLGWVLVQIGDEAVENLSSVEAQVKLAEVVLKLPRQQVAV